MSDITMEAFAAKTVARADQLKRSIGIKLFSAVIKSTPVGNPDLWEAPAPEGYVGGRLRANWQCSLGTADTTTTDSVAHAGAIPAMEAQMAGSNRDTVDFLTNSLPYAAGIEYDGRSTQAPGGMVRSNVLRFKKLLAGELQRRKSAG